MDGDGDAQRTILSDGVVALRLWSGADAAFMSESFSDPEIRRYNGAHDRAGHLAPPLTVAEAKTIIDGFISSWQAFTTTAAPTGVAFLIVDPVTGERVGCCGVDDWSESDVAQFGYWIAPSPRGCGYATRAVILLTRWLFELGAARAFVTIVEGNDASVAVARRAGFVHEGTMRSSAVGQGGRGDVRWYAALPEEWTPPGQRPEPEPRPTMFVMVGLPAAGKTARAKELAKARNAVRLTPDEWMIPLFGRQQPEGKRNVVEGRLIWLARSALRAGVDVVVDFGVWAKDERSALRALAASSGATCELVYLDVDEEEQWRRVVARSRSDAATTFEMTKAELEGWRASFQIPDADELAGSNLDPAPTGFASWEGWAAAWWPTSLSP